VDLQAAIDTVCVGAFTIRMQGKFHSSSTDDSKEIAIETMNEDPGDGNVLLLQCTKFLPVFGRPITLHHLMVIHFSLVSLLS